MPPPFSGTYLLVMTRLPVPGHTKTRLIPALGPEGSANFHDRLARHAIGRAASFCITRSARLRIHLAGGDPQQGRLWLGSPHLDCRPQAAGDLGDRMAAAVRSAFEDGARKVIVIGTDCPSLDHLVHTRALELLDRNDVIFVPATDGGYVLIAFSKFIPEIFENIPWGTGTVLTASISRAEMAGARFALLDPLPDVDLPADLPMAEIALAAGSRISVIIPTFNEESGLPSLLAEISKAAPHEIIVSDGGSTDRTPLIARASNRATLVLAPNGRAVQMNAGAAAATGEFLLFLHADTSPPPSFPTLVPTLLNRPGTAAGAFRFKLDSTSPAASLIERFVTLRCRLFATPYGDQGLFLRRSVFEAIGGFPRMEVMEDLEMIRTLGKLGRISITSEAAFTSFRRWSEYGLLRTFFRHQAMLAARKIGIPQASIQRFFRSR